MAVEQAASNLTAKYNDITLESLTLVGTTPDYTTVRDVSVGFGPFLYRRRTKQSSQSCRLGKTVAETLFPDSDPLGQVISVSNVKLTVIGVLAPKGLVSGTDFDAQMYTPITLVFKKFTPSILPGLLVTVSVPSSSPLKKAQICKKLSTRQPFCWQTGMKSTPIYWISISEHRKISSPHQESTTSFIQNITGRCGGCFADRWRYRDYEYYARQRY